MNKPIGTAGEATDLDPCPNDPPCPHPDLGHDDGTCCADDCACGHLLTHVVELPHGLPLLNANQRIHWRQRADLTRGLREATLVLARGTIPALQYAHIVCEYRPPDRRRRDVHNLYPSAKACVDGLVDAGVLPDDSDRYLRGPDMRIGPVEPGGCLVLHVTELEAL